MPAGSTLGCVRALDADASLPLTVEAAREHVAAGALRPGPLGHVGLELEQHLVDLRRPGARVRWSRLVAVLRQVPPLPGGSMLSVEPGGQVELSTPPAPDVLAAVDALRRDDMALRAALADAGLGLACLGADPARTPRRINPASRYAAMERHWAARGTRGDGTAMMCSTAALQVNLEAGPRDRWAQRIRLVHRLGPVLVAVSACSPMLAGDASGWRSMRQQVWSRLDAARCGQVRVGPDPASAWADYALSAPVMLVRDPGTGRADPVGGRVSFQQWVARDVALAGRRPTVADLDYHLTTLFPPVRLRGFLEVRFLDAVPRRWWPALAALVTVLMDDPGAADAAAVACEPVAGAWTAAAREGLRNREIARAAEACVQAAVAAGPPGLAAEMARYAELVLGGRSPGDEIGERVRAVGPLRLLEEAARG